METEVLQINVTLFIRIGLDVDHTPLSRALTMPGKIMTEWVGQNQKEKSRV